MVNWEIQGVRLNGQASITAWDVKIFDDLTVTDTTTLSGNVTLTGDITQTGDIALTGDLTGTGDLTRTGDVALTGDLTGTGDITRTGTLALTNTTTGIAGILVNSTDAAGDSQIRLQTTSGSLYSFINQDGNSDFYGTKALRIGHGGSLNATSMYLGASTNSFSLEAIELQTTAASGTNVTAGTVKINPNSSNIDFSVSGDTVADLISIDAGNDTFTLKPQTLPASPSAGTLAIDSAAANALKYYDGTVWKLVMTIP
jgi:hypothetical protein